MAKDFEIKESRRGLSDGTGIERVAGEIVEAPDKGLAVSGKDKLMGAVADNFGRILDLASSIASSKAEIDRMNAQADANIRELEEKRKMLETETEAYVKRINADTNATISKVDAIRALLNEYYACGKDTLSSEAFSSIIQDIISGIGFLNE